MPHAPVAKGKPTFKAAATALLRQLGPPPPSSATNDGLAVKVANLPFKMPPFAKAPQPKSWGLLRRKQELKEAESWHELRLQAIKQEEAMAPAAPVANVSF